jgi:energy-coupling factor transporter ATP-binding protein EcfA2
MELDKGENRKMTLVFHQVKLDRIMELNGSIDFPKGKTIVLYGFNQQGKTNIINAIRYAFLREAKGSGRPKTAYDEWALPTRKELVFDAEASIEIAFEHNAVPYVLQRNISDGARREELLLYSLKKPSQKLDVAEFFKNRLKVSLLDALFAPEIVGGFKRLYSGDIDQSIAEMFKDITTMRAVVMKFAERTQRMKIGAQAGLATIERSYNEFCESLVKKAPQLASLPQFTALQKLEISKTTQKIDHLHSKLQTIINKLKEQTLIKDVEEAKSKAKERDGVKREIGKDAAIKESFGKLRSIRSDYRKIQRWLRAAEKVTRITDTIPTPPALHDSQIATVLRDSYVKVTEAKKLHREMSLLATRNKVRPEAVSNRIMELSSISKILRKKAKIRKVLDAGVTEIANKAYAVLPVTLLAKHPLFSDISNEPIPKGTSQQKKQYQAILKAKIETLNKIRNLHENSQSEFDSFIKDDISELTQLMNNLGNRAENTKTKIQNWSTNLATGSSSFIGKKIRARILKSERDVYSFVKAVTRLMSAKEANYLKRLNSNLKELGIKIDELSLVRVKKALKLIMEEKKDLRALDTVHALLEENKSEWQKQEEVYSDYREIPSMTDIMLSVLQKIVAKCFDERKLKKLIAGTYNQIMKTMVERNLVRAILEMPEGELKAGVKYRDKPITHPAGSEKAFFSLAILTSLAHYFGTPVLIDEVANNLDSKNLKAFFELVKEFKERWNVQYVLSVKETSDFDLEGWVQDMSDHMKIYEVTEKAINLIL